MNLEQVYERWERKVRAEGKLEGKAEGKLEGKAEGKLEGKAEGKLEGHTKAVLVVVEGRGLSVSAAQRKQILACTDLQQLEAWLRGRARHAERRRVALGARRRGEAATGPKVRRAGALSRSASCEAAPAPPGSQPGAEATLERSPGSLGRGAWGVATGFTGHDGNGLPWTACHAFLPSRVHSSQAAPAESSLRASGLPAWSRRLRVRCP